jgi:hypothetical protein
MPEPTPEGVRDERGPGTRSILNGTVPRDSSPAEVSTSSTGPLTVEASQKGKQAQKWGRRRCLHAEKSQEGAQVSSPVADILSQMGTFRYAQTVAMFAEYSSAFEQASSTTTWQVLQPTFPFPGNPRAANYATAEPD